MNQCIVEMDQRVFQVCRRKRELILFLCEDRGKTVILGCFQYITEPSKCELQIRALGTLVYCSHIEVREHIHSVKEVDRCICLLLGPNVFRDLAFWRPIYPSR